MDRPKESDHSSFPLGWRTFAVLIILRLEDNSASFFCVQRSWEVTGWYAPRSWRMKKVSSIWNLTSSVVLAAIEFFKSIVRAATWSGFTRSRAWSQVQLHLVSRYDQASRTIVILAKLPGNAKLGIGLVVFGSVLAVSDGVYFHDDNSDRGLRILCQFVVHWSLVSFPLLLCNATLWMFCFWEQHGNDRIAINWQCTNSCVVIVQSDV